MSIFRLQFIILLFLISNLSLGQFHNYSIKYGIQSHLLKPSSEFDTDSYRLSLLGRGFLKFELNSYLETELGVGIGELNGKDFLNDNWSTSILPADIKLILSPFMNKSSSPYVYAGLQLIRWKISDFPKSESPQITDNLGWDFALPLGLGIEIALNNETLLDVNGGYSFAFTDDLNFYRNPDADDGYFNLGIGLTFVMGSGDSDEDKDGLTKSLELKIGTDPNNKDTDQDKLSDGDEINLYKTNPLDKDSDSDKISDFEEIIRYNTDPNSIDTDGDNIDDLDEIDIYKSDPLLKDTDNDHITDGYEINVYKTNPANKDTDADRLNDNDEIHTFNTDPLNKDSDGDTSLDGDEVYKFKTNPLKFDSVYIDKKNVQNNSQIPIFKSFILEGVNFKSDQAEILPESEPILKQTLQKLEDDPTLRIVIRGYTDSVGNAEYNKKLSLDRAQAVRIWLVKKGIDALRIKAVGLGESHPIADNNTPEGREKNRRIEIVPIQN